MNRDLCPVCWDQRCEGCSPPDTPSLDTSFHDHEMAVDDLDDDGEEDHRDVALHEQGWSL